MVLGIVDRDGVRIQKRVPEVVVTTRKVGKQDVAVHMTAQVSIRAQADAGCLKQEQNSQVACLLNAIAN